MSCAQAIPQPDRYRLLRLLGVDCDCARCQLERAALQPSSPSRSPTASGNESEGSTSKKKKNRKRRSKKLSATAAEGSGSDY
mmetsp:Transcript_55588/g.121089  ORF Transcript_55588/g.121089 Transcript_55588/m.121089 type:complete len:82 (+) Transcript_55588:43-288(+)